ncbi:hypothetical protein SAY87_023653 [Trapa incisa]|uniref:Protein TIFY n=1 Tax=Trapa incisa TaxID=236973 RepID=A0AAN7KY51_9MYRT|nr:hypothetical protein SAY87_023653 [Trapa incisa]
MASVPSILNKPLVQLTEDDISQVTREDCRKFLKDKGMRRPSWNKSQAIQQVVSLKALLEGVNADESGTWVNLREIVDADVADENPPWIQANSNSADSGKEVSAAAIALESAEEIIPSRQRDPPESLQPDVSPLPKETDKRLVSPWIAGTSEDLPGQMTIFYSGQVNVYDGVSADKARNIMLLAATPVHCSQDDLLQRTASALSFPYGVESMCDKPVGSSPVVAITSHTTDEEGQMSRKVSVQKYLEKRKDRGRLKVRKDMGPGSSKLEMFMNHQIRSSPPQPGVAHGTNLVGLSGPSVDLNGEGKLQKKRPWCELGI